MPAAYWTIRPCTDADTAAVLRLVRTVHGDRYPEINEKYWRWRYLNDAGFRACVFMAEHEGEPIGIRPVAIFEYCWGTDRLQGAMYTGVLTHPQHRRKGVFRSLVQAANAYVAKQGAAFCMTLPNDQSMPGFRNAPDWRAPDLIPVWFKLIDGRRAFAGRLGGPLAALIGRPAQWFFHTARESGLDDAITVAAEAPADLDPVADAFANDARSLMLRRSSAYWNWRFCAHPHVTYRTLTAQRNGRTIGIIATAVGMRMGVEMGMIIDVVASEGAATVRQLLFAAEADFRSRGIGLLACQATAPFMQQALRETGFRRPPPRLLPKRFNFVYRLTGEPGLPREPAALRDWHLMFSDSDNA